MLVKDDEEENSEEDTHYTFSNKWNFCPPLIIDPELAQSILQQ